jgi:TonB family protein
MIEIPSCSRFLTSGAFLALLLSPAVSGQQGKEFEKAAAQTAQAIRKLSGDSSAGRTVLVLDFLAPHDEPSALGVNLADNFSVSLRNYAEGFSIADRGLFAKKISDDRIPAESVDSVAACLAHELGASIVVKGYFLIADDHAEVHIRITNLEDSLNSQAEELNFDAETLLHLSPQMKRLRTLPPNRRPSPPIPGMTLWVNPQHAAEAPALSMDDPQFEKKGYTAPDCISCPSPQYAGKTFDAKSEGAVLMEVTVGTDGAPEKVSVTSGLPCGFNQQAIETVSQWKFSPGKGPQSKPVAVKTPVELVFHLL